MKDYFGWRTREADNAEMIDEVVCRKNGLELMKRGEGSGWGTWWPGRKEAWEKEPMN